MHRRSSFGPRHAVVFIVPLAVLTVLGLIFGRSLLGSTPDSALALSPVAKSPSSADKTPRTPEPTTKKLTPAKPKSLGVVKGSLTLKAPSSVAKGAFVVFVMDGPQRVIKTDAKAPFSVKVNTKALPNGKYTATVLWTVAGKSSVASTSTVQVKNAKPKTTKTTSKTSSGSGSGGGTTTNTGFAGQVLSLTNSERSDAGCKKALTISSKLTTAAQNHSEDMAAKDYFSHDSQDGRSPFDRMKDAGYKFSAAAENIAMGQPTPAAVMDAWMHSAGHKANILNCTYTQIGIGYAKNKSGAPYWTQDFGKPL